MYNIHTRTKNFCEFCTTFIPVPGTSIRSVRPCHNTRGTGTAFLYLPRTSVSSARPSHNTRNFWKFCNTFIPVPATSVISAAHSYPHLCQLCTPRATIPGVRAHHFLYPPGTSVSSVRPCHNTRNFCEFCNTSIPVPETSGSSVRLPYLPGIRKPYRT